MAGVFKLIHPAPLSVRMPSGTSCTYLYRVMYAIGWIPPKQGPRRYLYLCWSGFVFLVSAIYLPTGLGLSLFIDAKHFTPGEFLKVLQMFFNIIGASVKWFAMLSYLSSLHETRDAMDTLDEHVHSDGDRRKIHEAVARSNYMFLLYSKLYAIYTISDAIAGMVNRQPAWMMYNPIIDWRKGVWSLLAQSVIELIVMSLMACAILSMDTFTIVFINIFRAHLGVLKGRVRGLRQDLLMTDAEEYKQLVGCITYHQSIL